jgi:probable rRNA maturation factor
LAFDTRDDGAVRSAPGQRAKRIAGDIIISTDAALKNSRLYGTRLSEELALYVIHGILHLLGFDDHRPRDVEKMRKKEQELLASLGARAGKIVV